MTTRITATEIKQFRVISETKIEIELRNPIEPSRFELHFDLHICGASTAMAASVGGQNRTVMAAKDDSDATVSDEHP